LADRAALLRQNLAGRGGANISLRNKGLVGGIGEQAVETR
jgi:hypothetical protein